LSGKQLNQNLLAIEQLEVATHLGHIQFRAVRLQQLADVVEDAARAGILAIA
jgi:hypothetical protein